jgi:hypothetical protein
MTEGVQIHRLVVAPPSDVQAERDTIPSVVEELNKTVCADRGLRIEVIRWQTDTYPGFHPEGPQGLIDPILKIEDCDVLVGIFWKRFGSPRSAVTTGMLKARPACVGRLREENPFCESANTLGAANMPAPRPNAF